MKSVSYQIKNEYHVSGIENAVKTNETYRILCENATSGEVVPETGFYEIVNLSVSDKYGNEVDTFKMPCKWVSGYALCRNPYPTTPKNKWLLANPDGTAFFTAATPVLCRLYLRTISNQIKTAA